MTNLRIYITVVDIVFGTSAFAALFHSSFDVSEKTFFALVFITLAFMIEVYFLQSDSLKENYFEGLLAAIQSVEARIKGHEDINALDALEVKIKEFRIRDIAEGQGSPHAILITTRFGIWVLGGWLVERFLLPLL